MLDMMRIVRDGVLLSAVASTSLLVLMRFHPRLFARHYPQEIREIVPPKSEKERRISILLGLLLAAPFTSALLWRTATVAGHGFWELFAYAFGVLFIFNIVDLLIIDWLIVCWLKPRWTFIAGTEHIVIANPYLHHFKGFLMGTLGLLIVGFAVAGFLHFLF